MKQPAIVVYLASMALATSAPPFPEHRPGLPHTPPAFETRNTGVEKEEEAKFPDQEKKKPQKLKFTAVSDVRDWRDTKGTIIRGRLLAFEGGHHSASKKPLTLIRDGKMRLLVQGRKMFSELPMARLSADDQAFVKALDAARRKARTETE